MTIILIFIYLSIGAGAGAAVYNQEPVQTRGWNKDQRIYGGILVGLCWPFFIGWKLVGEVW